MLLIPASALVLPVLLSPINSPRNLIAGMALLLILAADVVCRRVFSSGKPLALIALALLISLSGLYGVGTIVETSDPTWLPHSSAAPAIRQEGIGWRKAQDLGLDPSAMVFALDYSIASQLRYYTGIPVQTSWGQYRLWGIPEITEAGSAGTGRVQIVALSYVSPVLVSERLHAAFIEVRGPSEVALQEGGERKLLRTWTASGPTVDTETFLKWFDFLDLIRAGTAYD
jgi:hypothetical protein